MAPTVRDQLHFPSTQRPFLEPYLPSSTASPSDHNSSLPFTTLTFATSLDSSLSLSSGTQTMLSGPASKAMTHYLRSRHAAILIGVGTAIADNPSLNCRLEGAGGYGGLGLDRQPVPVVVDPTGRWDWDAQDGKLMELVRDKRGRAPWIIVSSFTIIMPEKRERLEGLGGKYMYLSSEEPSGRLDWRLILSTIKKAGISSVMVEGGANVINALLAQEYETLISSIIVTIAPTWLGKGGVQICPERRMDGEGGAINAVRLEKIGWMSLGDDVVMCGEIKKNSA